MVSAQVDTIGSPVWGSSKIMVPQWVESSYDPITNSKTSSRFGRNGSVWPEWDNKRDAHTS